MSRGARTLIVIVVALAAAGASSFVVYRAVQSIPVREIEVRSRSVVVAARPLDVGTLLTAKDVKLVDWPERSVVPGSIFTPEGAVGRGLIAAVAENEPITATKLASPESGAGLPPTIPPGMRAMSIKVDQVIGVAGFVVPGSYVDVLVTVDEPGGATVTRTVVSRLRVLTAGTRYDEEEARRSGKPIPTTVVTLLVTPEDAERIALASAKASVTLALRNPLDTEPTVTSGIRLAALVGPASPPPVEKNVGGRKVVRAVAPPPPPPPPPQYVVEAYKGAQKTEVVIRNPGEVIKK
jgi:pilus assembly protein CpaB